VLALLEEVGLPDPPGCGMVYPHQLSGGQRQRAMIAMALALDPVLLIADEPTTALDVTTQAQILALLARSADRASHGGILLITHDFGVVREIADRVAVMQHGRVVEAGAADVLNRPQHPYTPQPARAVPRLEPRRRPLGRPRPTRCWKDAASPRPTGRGGFTGRKRRVAALDGVSSPARGETLGIVGESGSGKSTLAKCSSSASSMTRPGTDAGRHRGDLADAGRRDLPCAGAPAHPDGLPGPLQVAQPAPPGGTRSWPRGCWSHGVPTGATARARVDELLALVGPRSRRLPSRFPTSSRAGSASASASPAPWRWSPRCWSPTSRCRRSTSRSRRRCWNCWRELRRKLGFSILFITHDLRVASQVCDRVGVMRRGVVVEIGADGRSAVPAAARIHAPAAGLGAGPRRRRGGPSLGLTHRPVLG
jgi:peptide/nickel transport system ATP-binding protein